MANKKYDGVVEGVRYTPEGKVKLVRVYLRRGTTWSDLMLMTREDFISVLKTGKRMVAGKRVDFMGGTFDVSDAIQLKGNNGQENIYITQPGSSDNLEGIPLF
jgi:hypothetical protein